MSLQVEKLKNMAKLTIEVSADELNTSERIQETEK